MRNIIEKFKSKGIIAQYFISFALIYLVFELIKLFQFITYSGNPWLAPSLNDYFQYLFIDLIWILIISIPLFPIYFIIRDKRLEKERKIGWLVLVFFFNWLAFAFYLIKKKD
jgi:uncharacterized membrane protein